MSRCPRCQAGPRWPSPTPPTTPREASSGSPADPLLGTGSRVVPTATISLKLDGHLAFGLRGFTAPPLRRSKTCALSNKSMEATKQDIEQFWRQPDRLLEDYEHELC